MAFPKSGDSAMATSSKRATKYMRLFKWEPAYQTSGFNVARKRIRSSASTMRQPPGLSELPRYTEREVHHPGGRISHVTLETTVSWPFGDFLGIVPNFQRSKIGPNRIGSG